MSKIKELLNNPETVLAFDMDGVLSTLEFGEYNHYEMTDAEWAEANKEEVNYYTEDKVIKKIQNYLKTRDMNNIYVISKTYTPNETKCKIDFLTKNYNIKENNIFFVDENEEKADILKQIRERYPDKEDYQIGMVEDTVDVLNDIMEKTNFSTIHISSFIDL
jgi:soluble P-type ATPase